MNSVSTCESNVGGRTAEPRFGTILCVWMLLIVALNGARWVSGFRPVLLSAAVERGVRRIENDAAGEMSDAIVRKAIRTHRDSLPFWSVVYLIGDFVIEPAALTLRALAAAIGFTAIAATTGRPIQFERACSDCARLQGFWVLGLAVRVGLMIGLRRGDDELETSLGMFLAPGTHPAATWLLLRECDVFAMVGWASLAAAGRRRGDANLAAAVALCATLGLVETGLRASAGLVVGSAMRRAIDLS